MSFFLKSSPKIFYFSLIILLWAGCKEEQKDKIPITTSSKEALKDFIEGRDLSEKLRVQEALPYLKSAIKKDKNFALAYLFAAFSQPTAKDFFNTFNKAVSLVDMVSEGERNWILGVQAGVNGLPMKQRGYFIKLVQDYPEDERAHNLLGTYYFGQQEYNLAIKEYRRATEINPNFSQPYNQLGYSHRFLENFEEAEDAFDKYIKLIPNDPNPYDSYAELKMKIGEYLASIELYKKALEFDPHFVASHIGIATNLNFLNRHEEAREQLRKLYEIARNQAEQRQAKFAMAVSFVDEGKYEAGIQEIIGMYNLAKESEDKASMAQDLINIGNILFEQEKFDDALKKYEESINLIRESDLSNEIKTNGESLFLYNRARIACRKQDCKTAIELLEKYTNEVMKTNNRFLLWLSHSLAGIIAFGKKDYDKALGEFGRSNLQNPYNLYRMALAYEAKGDRLKAKEFLQKAANHNTLNSLEYAFIRRKAQAQLNLLD
jgi:tetratricopeptide (TPR) repeat protein